MREIIFEFVLFLNLIKLIASGLLQLWTFELLEMTTNSNNHNWVDLNLNIVRLGRGRYGFSGFINFNMDLYNDVFVRGTIARSTYRDGPYKKLPMKIDNETLTNAMNIYYKPIIQPVAEKCCINCPIVKDKFQAPLTKRNVQFSECALTTDNLPNITMEGYYLLNVTLFGPFEMYVSALSIVERIIY